MTQIRQNVRFARNTPHESATDEQDGEDAGRNVRTSRFEGTRQPGTPVILPARFRPERPMELSHPLGQLVSTATTMKWTSCASLIQLMSSPPGFRS